MKKDKPKSIAQYIRRFVDNKSVYISPFIVSGNLNTEYIRGNHNKKINPITLNIENKKYNPSVYTERKFFNRILPLYLTRYGILTDNMPIPGFKPSDKTSKRVFDALQGNKFLNNFLTDCNFRNTYEKIVKYADVYGLCWVKTGIDWTQGDTIEEVEVTSKTENEREVYKGKLQIKEGRPFIEFCPLEEVIPDTIYAEDMDRVNELVHRRAFPIDVIKKKLNFDAKPEAIDTKFLASYPEYNDTLMRLNDGPEYAYVYEYYKRPDALYPKGRYTIVVNDKVLFDGILPFENGPNGTRKIPFDIVRLQSVPQHLFGVTVYSQLIPIQDTYNSVKNRYLEYVNHIAIGQMYVWESSLVNKSLFTTTPGRMIEIKRNARKPEPVIKDKLGVEFINYLKTLEEDMLVTAGISQLTAFGQSKSNVRTDGVVDKIAESDENKLANALENISNAIIEIFKKVIYAEKQREILLTDKLAEYNIDKRDEYISKYKLKNVDAEQLIIVNRAFLKQSDQRLDKKLQQASQLGLYSPEAGLSYISKLEWLDALDSDYLKDTLDPAERATHDLICEEHCLFLEPDNPKVEQWHLHDQHIFEHNLFRISPEVRQLKYENPELYEAIQQAIDSHIMEHSRYIGESGDQSIYQNAKALLNSYS